MVVDESALESDRVCGAMHRVGEIVRKSLSACKSMREIVCKCMRLQGSN